MPGVICYRTPSEDCALLGHLYRSSPHPGAPSRTTRQEPTQGTGTSNIGSSVSLTSHKEPGSSAGSGSALLSVSSLLLLSPEVVLLILANLPGRDILCCRFVCKPLKQYIDQSAKLRYIVQANARGLEPLHHAGSAHLCLARLLSREQNWAMFGSISSSQFTIKDPPHSEHKAYYFYGSGKVLAYRGQYAVEHSLQPCATREYEVPGLENVRYNQVTAFQDWLGFTSGEAVRIYSIPDNEIVSVLSGPHRGVIDSMQFRGDLVAAMFRPERRCSGVLVWDRKSGKLIETLLLDSAPALSFTFLDDTTLALVRTDRSARSAHIDTYTIGYPGAILQNSLALPDAYPTKWYARADIHTGNNSVQRGSERLTNSEGIVAIDLELRIRAPHDPNTNTTDRRLSVILVIQKSSIMNIALQTGNTPRPVSWHTWSNNHFRLLVGVRLSSNSSVWGHRLIALGPELDKISLFDFCPVGVRTAARVWNPSCGRVSVSVRAALAQRARTLVRANELGIGSGWFDGMKPMVGQAPYVVSIRRGMMDVREVWLNGENIVALRNDEGPEDSSSKVTWFDFSLTV